MAPDRADLERAIADYWGVRDNQTTMSLQRNSTAEGTAGSVRADGHFAPIAELLARFFVDAGYPAFSIGVRRPRVVLPAVFRPTKQWDLVVIHRGVLVAAIELKGLGGDPRSIGKNYNNRVEEALGNALDVDRANDLGLVGPEKPWLGYFFVMEDHPSTRVPKQPMGGVLPAEDVWRRRSHQERFSLTAERLIDAGLYDAVCYLVSSPSDPGPREPCRRADWEHFAAAIEARIHYLSRLGYP